MNNKTNKNLRYSVDETKWGGEEFYKSESEIKKHLACQFLDFKCMIGVQDATPEEMIKRGIFRGHYFIPTEDSIKMFEVIDYNTFGEEISWSWFPLSNLQLLAATCPDNEIECDDDEQFNYLVFKDRAIK